MHPIRTDALRTMNARIAFFLAGGRREEDGQAMRHAAPPTTARILIADDNLYARIGLRAALEEAPELTVVGEVATGADAVDLCATLSPDLAILDLRMPVMDGLQAAIAIRATYPRTRVLLISVVDTRDERDLAHVVGADAFLPKDA